MFTLSDDSSEKIIKHNNKIFDKKDKNTKNIFLLEFNGWHGLHIANSYLINSLSEIKDCKIVAYESYRLFQKKPNFFLQNLKWKIGSSLKLKTFKIYESFGTDEFMYTKDNFLNSKKAKQITEHFFSKLWNKKDVESFSVKGVWIGDLIYDSYLKLYDLPTIDLESSKFKVFFENSISLFLFWFDYFKKKNVKGIASSHGVYLNAIPLRIALKFKILTLVCSDNKLFKLNNKIYSSKYKTTGVELQHKYFKKLFNGLTNQEKTKAYKKGKKFLRGILQEKKNYFYFPKKKTKIKPFSFKKNNLPKIVIFAHSFTDSPHLRGNSLFPDFYEWLNFLAKIAKKTEYDWYIKPHPNYSLKENKFINQFVKKNPIIKKLSPYTRNIDMINKGLNFALTVYGSCAAELPYYGIKVVNACKNNPHSDYKFSITPDSISKLEKVIINLNKIKLKFSKNELYEYHYMNQFYFSNKYIFSEIDKYHFKKKGRPIMYTKEVYDKWIKNFSLNKHEQIKKSINAFLKSNEYLLARKF